MRGSSYQEQDYAFGKIMLTVRAHIGLTQAELGKNSGRLPENSWQLGKGQQLSRG